MKSLIQFVLSVLVTLSLVDYLKEVFKVPRPTDALVQLSDYAFPSGHSATAFAITTFFVYKIIKSKKHPWIKFFSITAMFIVTILIVCQRLIIKVHTIDQVVVGSFLGIFVSLIMIKFVNLVSDSLKKNK